MFVTINVVLGSIWPIFKEKPPQKVSLIMGTTSIIFSQIFVFALYLITRAPSFNIRVHQPHMNCVFKSGE